eukprot:999849-Alexandrium_andersonii.AAC.1
MPFQALLGNFQTLLGAFQHFNFAEERLKLPRAAPWLAKAFQSRFRPLWWSVVGGLAPPFGWWLRVSN